jgi:Flp pilus assembly protein TadG
MRLRPTRPLPKRPRQPIAGIAAIELALLLPVLVLFLTFPIFFARCMWQYTMVQKAAQDATRYLSTVSAAEMRSNALTNEAVATAAGIVARETAELASGSRVTGLIAYCDDVVCGTLSAGTVPTTVRVRFMIYMKDDIFGVIDTGRYGITVTADARMGYAGT